MFFNNREEELQILRNMDDNLEALKTSFITREQCLVDIIKRQNKLIENIISELRSLNKKHDEKRGWFGSTKKVDECEE
jgi:hypothetical protein